MPLPRYQRLSEVIRSIEKKIWGLRPRNPTWGLISLKMGIKMYALGNVIMQGVHIMSVLVVMYMLFVASNAAATHQQLKKGVHNSKPSGEDPMIKKLLTNQPLAYLAFIISSFTSGFLMALFWTLNEVVDKRNLPMLKIYFFMVLSVELFELFCNIDRGVFLCTAFFIFDLLFTILTAIGIIFTYSFIATLANLHYKQEEDAKRVHYDAL